MERMFWYLLEILRWSWQCTKMFLGQLKDKQSSHLIHSDLNWEQFMATLELFIELFHRNKKIVETRNNM